MVLYGLKKILNEHVTVLESTSLLTLTLIIIGFVSPLV